MFKNAVETFNRLTMNRLGRCYRSYMFLHKYYLFDKCEYYAGNINFCFTVDMVGHAQKRSGNFHDVTTKWLHVGHTCICRSACTINLINANVMQETSISAKFCLDLLWTWSNILKNAVETFMT